MYRVSQVRVAEDQEGLVDGAVIVSWSASAPWARGEPLPQDEDDFCLRSDPDDEAE